MAMDIPETCQALSKMQPQSLGSTGDHGSLSISKSRFSKVSSCLRRKAIHRWTMEEQAVLCIMERWFESKKPIGKRLLTYQGQFMSH